MRQDLATWLREQIDEVERIARSARDDYFTIEVLGLFSSIGDARHVIRHNPDHVLAEVEAKRRILDLTGPDVYDDDGRPRYLGGYGEAYWDVLRLLAVPFAGRPGYREEWRP